MSEVNVAGSEGGHGHTPMVWGDDCVGIRGLGTALPPVPRTPWNFPLCLIPTLLGVSGYRGRKPEYPCSLEIMWMTKIT